MESLTGFFNDNGKNGNAKKKPYLKEIFKVAKTEEQYKRGEIDAGTEVFVMSDDKTPDGLQSDREDDGDEGSVRSSRVSPPKVSGPHSVISATSSGHSPVPNLRPAPPFMGDIPVRGPQFPPPILPGDLASGQHGYVESGAMQGHAPIHIPELMAGSHDNSRRTPSMFSSAGAEFSNPSGLSGASATGIYGPSWQQTTTAPPSAALYSFPAHQPGPGGSAGPFVGPPGVSLGQGSQYLGSQFHNVASAGDVYRGNNVGQNPVSHGPGYPNYLTTQDANSSIKMDPINRNAMH